MGKKDKRKRKPKAPTSLTEAQAAVTENVVDFVQEFQEDSVAVGSLFREIASIQNTFNIFRLVYELPDPDPVLLRHDSGPEILDDLMGDDRVTTAVMSRKEATIRKEWTWEAGLREGQEEPEADAVAMRDFVARYLTPERLQHKIAEILDAPYFGYVPVEIMYAPEEGRIGAVDVRPRPRNRFKWNGRGEPRFYPDSNQVDGEPLPPFKFAFAQHYPKELNPYGLRLLSRCFWPVTFKRSALRFWVQFMEMYGMAHVIAQIPRAFWEVEKGADVAEKIREMVQAGIGVVPEGTDVNFLQAGTGQASAFWLMIQVLNDALSQILLGETLTTDPGERGARSLGEVQERTLEDRKGADERIVERFFNEVARFVSIINTGGRVPAPRFSYPESEDLQRDRAERDSILTAQGVRFDNSYYRRHYGFEEGDLLDQVDDGTNGFPQEFQRRTFVPQDRVDEFIVEQLQQGVNVSRREAQSLEQLARSATTVQELEDGLLRILGPENPQYQAGLEQTMLAAHMYGRTTL